jgi:hypothetical protein
MKVTRKLETPVDVIEDVFCNKCGSSCKSPQGGMYGLIEATVSGGYESNYLGDGDVHTFSLCERCVSKMIGSFKISSLQGNYLFPNDPHVEGFDPIDPSGKVLLVPEEDPGISSKLTFQDVIDALERDGSFTIDTLGPIDGDDDMVELIGEIPPKIKKEDMN